MGNQAVYERYQAGGRNFEGAHLPGAYLPGIDLRDARLRRADLRGADLGDANLSRADLKGANLRSANLRHAFLQDADLRLVDLADADLRGASLEGADLRGANLFGTLLDKNTRIADRWRQVWELVNQEGEPQASRLEVTTWINPGGGVRADLLIDGEPLTGGALGVDLHALALSSKEGGAYWLIVCPSCGTPGCVGIRWPMEVSWDGDQVHWATCEPGSEGAWVFDGDAYRAAIRQGLRDFVDCCRQHPGTLMDRMSNCNCYLANVDLDRLLEGSA